MSVLAFARVWCPLAQEACRLWGGIPHAPEVVALGENLVEGCLSTVYRVAIQEIEIYIVEGVTLEDLLDYHGRRVGLVAFSIMERRMAFDRELMARCRVALRSSVCRLADSADPDCPDLIEEHVKGVCGSEVAKYVYDLQQQYAPRRRR